MRHDDKAPKYGGDRPPEVEISDAALRAFRPHAAHDCDAGPTVRDWGVILSEAADVVSRLNALVHEAGVDAARLEGEVELLRARTSPEALERLAGDRLFADFDAHGRIVCSHGLGACRSHEAHRLRILTEHFADGKEGSSNVE